MKEYQTLRANGLRRLPMVLPDVEEEAEALLNVSPSCCRTPLSPTPSWRRALASGKTWMKR